MATHIRRREFIFPLGGAVVALPLSAHDIWSCRRASPGHGLESGQPLLGLMDGGMGRLALFVSDRGTC
jgi:hypothetical protein